MNPAGVSARSANTTTRRLASHRGGVPDVEIGRACYERDIQCSYDVRVRCPRTIGSRGRTSTRLYRGRWR